jgi:hypothetical protein
MALQTLRRPLAVFAAVLLASAISMAFGWLHTLWFDYPSAAAQEVLLLFAAATLAVAGLFIAGQLARVRGHAYYVILSGVAFLAVDAVIWWRFGIMPGPKSYQDGFVPAAIMGVFLARSTGSLRLSRERRGAKQLLAFPPAC